MFNGVIRGIKAMSRTAKQMTGGTIAGTQVNHALEEKTPKKSTEKT